MSFSLHMYAISINSQMFLFIYLFIYFKFKYLIVYADMLFFEVDSKHTFFRCSLIYNEPIVHCHMVAKMNRGNRIIIIFQQKLRLL